MCPVEISVQTEYEKQSRKWNTLNSNIQTNTFAQIQLLVQGTPNPATDKHLLKILKR